MYELIVSFKIEGQFGSDPERENEITDLICEELVLPELEPDAGSGFGRRDVFFVLPDDQVSLDRLEDIAAPAVASR